MERFKSIGSGIASALLALLLLRLFSAFKLNQGFWRPVVILVSFLLPLFLFARLAASRPRRALLRPCSPLPFFACFAGMLLSDLILGSFASAANSTQSEPIALTLICSVLLAPILEEMLFRGFVLPALLPVSSFGAVLISSVFFGLAHPSPLAMVHAVFCGSLLAVLTLNCRCLLPAILAHSLFNLLSLLSSLGGIFEKITLWGRVLFLVLGAVCTILLLICHFMKRKAKKT